MIFVSLFFPDMSHGKGCTRPQHETTLKDSIRLDVTQLTMYQILVYPISFLQCMMLFEKTPHAIMSSIYVLLKGQTNPK
jgi:hypothetical protein